MNAIPISGTTDERFEAVRDAFATNFVEHAESGAAVTVYHKGRQVVNLWGGERAPGSAWTADTLVPTLSVGKAISALAIQMLYDRKRLDLSAAVSESWPEFAAHGKGRVSIAAALTHRAGVPWFPGYEDIACFDSPASFARSAEIYAALASAPPVWPPGTQCGSHSITVGWLHAQILRRITGRPLREFVAQEIARPLGAELWFGLDDETARRAAVATGDVDQDSAEVRKKVNPDTPAGKTLFLGWKVPPGAALGQAVNDPIFRQAEVPAANMFATTDSLARVFAALADGGMLDGVRLVSEESVALFTAEQHRGPDAIFPTVVSHSLGYILPVKGAVEYGPNDTAFGHPARSGAIAFADPTARIGFAYLPAKQRTGYATDPRAGTLIDSVYRSLANAGH
jgi:CubicO group peptidase (beta-lactamase class C family)